MALALSILPLYGNEVLLSIANLVQLALLVFLQREQSRVKKELADHNGQVVERLDFIASQRVHQDP